MLGHRASEYKTTEICAHYAPDYLGDAAKAIDSYFTELQGLVTRPLILNKEEDLRVSCVLAKDLPLPQVVDLMVGASGIEPPTTTMSR